MALFPTNLLSVLFMLLGMIVSIGVILGWVIKKSLTVPFKRLTKIHFHLASVNKSR